MIVWIGVIHVAVRVRSGQDTAGYTYMLNDRMDRCDTCRCTCEVVRTLLVIQRC
jgi:hypothetical protein